MSCGGPHASAEQESATPMSLRVVVGAEGRNEVDPRLFGHFLEIASWGELGPEAWADPETGELPAVMIDLLERMDVTFVRYPGGGDVPHIDWTDRIDNAPGREPGAGRPITKPDAKTPIENKFGYDEYFALAERLGWETTIPVNLLDALVPRKPLDEVARHAAGLVAYANAPLGADLPEGMPDWPAIRAQNGRPEPYGVKVWQIGNEIFLFNHHTLGLREMDDAAREDLGDRLVEAIVAIADAMRAVAPDIELMIDHNMGDRDMERRVWSDPAVRARIDWLTFHRYGPWAMNTVGLDGETLPPGEIGLDALWAGWVSMPGRL
ncbi:MAG: hypothetical protein AAF710_11930, partial [Planctomycetota bacterium]